MKESPEGSRGCEERCSTARAYAHACRGIYEQAPSNLQLAKNPVFSQRIVENLLGYQSESMALAD